MLSSPRSMRTRSGFTLIELLVVIAIIAILAAILFPVFAQAREKARQTSCISNYKQVSLSTLMYVQDYDELMPMAFGYDGQWLYGFYGYAPYNDACTNGVCGGAFSGGEQAYWLNAIQPYTKNWGVAECPDATTLMASMTPASGAPAAVKTSEAYNGMLQSFPLAGIVEPSMCPMATESWGKAYMNGLTLANPILLCSDATQMTCYYNHNTGQNGSSGTAYQMSATLGVHSNGGQIFAYCDGHVKFKLLSLQDTTVTTNYNNEPWAEYNTAGIAVSYWQWCYTAGCLPYYFSPDLAL